MKSNAHARKCIAQNGPQEFLHISLGQKRTCLRASRHLFDNEQMACMEASFKFNHQLPSSSSCKRRGGSGLSGFSAATAFALHANFADEYVATRRNRQLLQVSAGRIKKRVRTSITMSSP
jgi:hypothetical protein